MLTIEEDYHIVRHRYEIFRLSLQVPFTFVQQLRNLTDLFYRTVIISMRLFYSAYISKIKASVHF